MDKCLNIKLHDLDQKQLGIHFEIQEMTIFYPTINKKSRFFDQQHYF